MKKLYVMALAFVLVGWAVVVFAAPPDPGMAPPGPGAPHQWAHPHHGCGSFLNLTQEQREKMKELGQRVSGPIPTTSGMTSR